MKFKSVIGHKALGQRLRNGVNIGRIPHAQMFLGTEGCGNLALALAYAQYVLCTARTTDDSCGDCPSCRKFATLTHPDVHFSFPFPSNKGTVATELYEEWRQAAGSNAYMNYEMWMTSLDASSKQGNIPIKECHAILKNLSLKPFESEYKVLIMWLPEYLGSEGNVLLKAIEEPAQKTLFLLVAENAEKILTTILSRVQLVRVPPVAAEDICQWLVSEKGMGEEDAKRVGLMAAGNLLRAAELSGNDENHFLEPFRTWMGHCYKKDLPGAFAWGDEFAGGGREQLKGFFIYALEMLRAILVYPVAGAEQGLSSAETEFVSRFSLVLKSHAGIELAYQWFNDAAYEVERNANPRLVLADLSFKLARLLK